MSDKTPRCPACGKPANSASRTIGRRAENEPPQAEVALALPCGCRLTHAQYRAFYEQTRPLWRFDVPAIPPGVTAVQDDDGDVYVRRADDPNRWSRWLADIKGEYRISISTKGLLFALPLVECPDPRKDPT